MHYNSNFWKKINIIKDKLVELDIHKVNNQTQIINNQIKLMKIIINFLLSS